MNYTEDFVIRNNSAPIVQLSNSTNSGYMYLHAVGNGLARLGIYGHSYSALLLREEDVGQDWLYAATSKNLYIEPEVIDKVDVHFRNVKNETFFKIRLDTVGGSHLRFYDTENTYLLDKLMTIDSLGRVGFKNAAMVNDWLGTWESNSGVISTVTTSDRIQIGATAIPTGAKMSVDGKIIATEVEVDVTGNWPDYVFSPDYELQSLSSLSDYILKNRHLPNIPSASEVAENGIALGAMNAKLLEKIEELTLYTIDQDSQLSAQEQQLMGQKVQISQQEGQLARQEELIAQQQQILQSQQAQIDALMKRLNQLEKQ